MQKIDLFFYIFIINGKILINFVNVSMHILSRLRQMHLILQEFSIELSPLIYVNFLYFHNVFRMFGILCRFFKCFGT